MLAADSALKGQATVRSERVWRAAYAVRTAQADTLQNENTFLRSGLLLQTHATEQAQGAAHTLDLALIQSDRRLRRARKAPWIAAILGALIGVLATR